MKAIFKRELSSYFKSPLGYIFLGLFVSYSALMFLFSTVPYQTSDMSNYFVSVCYIFILAVPLITMKMFSEERKQKTDQLWLTAPVKVSSVVMGKFLSALSVLAIGIAVTFIFLVFLALYGNPAVIQSIIGYIGVLLYGAMLIAMGMLISSLTQNQIISAVITLAAIGIFSIVPTMGIDFSGLFDGAFSFVGTALNGMLAFIDINARFYDFAKGTLNIVPLVYFISITALFVFLTVCVIERRRWR